MSVRRTSKGKVIDLDALIKSQEDTISIGNMNVNAKGDRLGPGGEVIQSAEERVREQYENNPPAETVENVSPKGNTPTKVDFDPGSTDIIPEPKTAKTAQAEQRAQDKIEQVKKELEIPVEAPNQYADREAKPETTPAPAPTPPKQKFKEVELPNGDFEMIPIDEWDDDETPSN